jgi:2-amino-4-hydroxy-6-hydroxymethyldihydropteridine diphosphokinase
MHRISSALLHNVSTSSLYATAPVGFSDQPFFVNAAMAGTTALAPASLHTALKHLEVALGRVPREQWHEREIDIDVILFGSEVISTDSLQIPHPRFRDRRFVLEPAAEIAAHAIDPVTGLSIAHLLESCTDTALVTMLPSPLPSP